MEVLLESTVENIQINTGSAATLLSAEVALELGLEPELYEKKIDSLKLGDAFVPQFTIQIGAMDYGMDMNGILGTVFLLAVGAAIDMKKLEITVAGSSACSIKAS